MMQTVLNQAILRSSFLGEAALYERMCTIACVQAHVYNTPHFTLMEQKTASGIPHGLLLYESVERMLRLYAQLVQLGIRCNIILIGDISECVEIGYTLCAWYSSWNGNQRKALQSLTGRCKQKG
jgi:hypothetical protein